MQCTLYIVHVHTLYVNVRVHCKCINCMHMDEKMLLPVGLMTLP